MTKHNFLLIEIVSYSNYFDYLNKSMKSFNLDTRICFDVFPHIFFPK